MNKTSTWLSVILAFFCMATLFTTVPVQGAKATRDDVILRLDDERTEPGLPKNFRRVDTVGISGSAQFTQVGVQAMAEALAGKTVIDVDLRQESHGFINGFPFSGYGYRNWANLGKFTPEVLTLEAHWLQKVSEKKEIVLHQRLKKDKQTGQLENTEQRSLIPEQVLNEEAVVRQVGWGYYRLAVTDHRRPLDGDVNTFVTFVRALPETTWLHFHCEAGHGRTTTFMTMYDMMKNAKKDSMEQILSRQTLPGAIDLRKVEGDGWQAVYAEERLSFIKQFYQYCRENEDDFSTSWTDWLEKE